MFHKFFALVLMTASLLGMMSTTSAQSNPIVKTGEVEGLGTVLVDSNSMTLYVFANDTDGTSTCEGDCANSWPPYVVEEGTELVADAGIDGVLGTTTRSDGSLQVKLDNRPLYYFITDEEPGEANGEGAGGVWYTVKFESVDISDEQATEEPDDSGEDESTTDTVNGEVIIEKTDTEELGSILVAVENGMTLYTFANDEDGVSNCVAQCLELWPAFTVNSADAAIAAGEGIPGELSVIEREEGVFQVTLDNRPLYFYSEDTAPGDTNGQGVGSVWFVVSVDTVRAASNETLGSILVAQNGMTLYTFANDEDGVSNCIAQCAELWPAFTVDSADAELVAGTGVPGELGIIEREEGVFQVTLDNRPLYFYSEDAAPGDTNGQGVGSVWFVVSVDTVRVAANAEHGAILTAANGMTLYRFTNDEPGWSNCVGPCTDTWAPLTVDDAEALFAVPGILELLATSERADGALQVTFDNQPLYFFAGDNEPGDTNGHGVGEVWSVIAVDPNLAAAAGGVSCELTVGDFENVNLRSGPSTDTDTVRQVSRNEVVKAVQQVNGADGYIWYKLDTGEFVRSDVVIAAAECQSLPAAS